MAQKRFLIQMKNKPGSNPVAAFAGNDALLGSHDFLINGSHDVSWPIKDGQPFPNIRVRRDPSGDLFLTLEQE